MPGYTMRTTRGNVYTLDAEGYVIARSNGPQGWNYSKGWRIVGAATRHNASRITPLARIAGNLYREELNGLRRRGHTDGLLDVDRFIARAAPKMLRDGTLFERNDAPTLLPEAAFSWPLYRAAMVDDVYGALWGQASDAEERVLATLAHCAGIRPSLGVRP